MIIAFPAQPQNLNLMTWPDGMREAVKINMEESFPFGSVSHPQDLRLGFATHAFEWLYVLIIPMRMTMAKNNYANIYSG